MKREQLVQNNAQAVQSQVAQMQQFSQFQNVNPLNEFGEELMGERDPLVEHFQNFDVNAVDQFGYEKEGQQQEAVNSSGTRNQDTSILRRSVTEQDLKKMRENELM